MTVALSVDIGKHKCFSGRITREEALPQILGGRGGGLSGHAAGSLSTGEIFREYGEEADILLHGKSI